MVEKLKRELEKLGFEFVHGGDVSKFTGDPAMRLEVYTFKYTGEFPNEQQKQKLREKVVEIIESLKKRHDSKKVEFGLQKEQFFEHQPKRLKLVLRLKPKT